MNPLRLKTDKPDLYDRRALIGPEEVYHIDDRIVERGRRDNRPGEFVVKRTSRITLADARVFYSQLGFHSATSFETAIEKYFGPCGPTKKFWIFFYKPTGNAPAVHIIGGAGNDERNNQ